MKFVKWLLLLAVVVALALGVLRALKAREAKQARAAEAAAALLVPPVFELDASDVYTVARVELTQNLPITGTVTAPQSATLKSATAGDVVEWRVREGERVQAGQILGRIDATDLRSRLSQAEQQARAVQATVEVAQRQHNNNQSLAEQGFISSTALQASQANLVAAQANAAAAQANVTLARNALSDSVVRAPFAGQVAQRWVQQGDRVAVNGALVTLVDASQLELEVALTAEQVRGVTLGQRATLRAQGLPEPLQATVSRINPSLSAGSRSALVYLSLPAGAAVRDGEFLSGDLRLGQHQTLAVPSTAVHHEKPEPYIQVLQDGVVQHRQVKIGAHGHVDNEPWVSLSGLQPNEQVLRLSSGILPQGTHATVRAPVARRSSQ